MTRLNLKRHRSAIAVVLACLGAPSISFAQPSRWDTDAVESTDGRYLFVSISDRPLDEELKDEGLTGEERDQIEFFRLHYPVSGMYLNDNSNTPLWEFDEPWRGEPIVAPDGEHVVFQGAWTRNENDSDHGDQAVEFLHRGRTIRSYAASDFISTYWLKHLLSGWETPGCQSKSFDPQAMTYTIVTNQGEEYVFNVKNGRLLEVDSPFPLYYTLLSVAAAGLIIGPFYWIRRKKMKGCD